MSHVEPEPRPTDAQATGARSMVARAGAAVVRLANGVTAVVAAIAAVLALVLTVGGPDKVPKPPGAAAAPTDPTPAYERDVGRVCDALNADARALTRSNRSLPRRIGRARTTAAQRRVLLDDQRRLVSRAGDALARFRFLDAPPSHRRLHETTVKAWSSNVDRIRRYAQRLDGVQDRDSLLRAIESLSTTRRLLGEDGEILMAGLLRLGGSHCDLERPPVTRSVSLPPVRKPGTAGAAPASGSPGAGFPATQNSTPLTPNIAPPAASIGGATAPPPDLGRAPTGAPGSSIVEE